MSYRFEDLLCSTVGMIALTAQNYPNYTRFYLDALSTIAVVYAMFHVTQTDWNNFLVSVGATPGADEFTKQNLEDSFEAVYLVQLGVLNSDEVKPDTETGEEGTSEETSVEEGTSETKWFFRH